MISMRSTGDWSIPNKSNLPVSITKGRLMSYRQTDMMVEAVVEVAVAVGAVAEEATLTVVVEAEAATIELEEDVLEEENVMIPSTGTSSQLASIQMDRSAMMTIPGTHSAQMYGRKSLNSATCDQSSAISTQCSMLMA